MAQLNYKHLHYFWVVAKEGGISRAAERLGIAVQTVSGQLKLLEQSLGTSLFAAQGRGLTLTEAGRLALGYADQIFLLGNQLLDALADPALSRTVRLAVGISDALPKLVAYNFLQPAVLSNENLRLVCHEGEVDELLAELALHKLDVVLADRPISTGGGLRIFSHALGSSAIAVFGAPDLAAKFRNDFPRCLDGSPWLMPSRHTAIRARLDLWFESHHIRPNIVGEFEDSALLATFGRTGRGLFPAPSILTGDLAQQFGVEAVGLLGEVREEFYAISNERRIRHPAVEAILAATRNSGSLAS